MYFNKPIITITGTNGKGSCAAICEAILIAQGYRVGCYTSPHLIHFNERIRYDGHMATEEEITQAYQSIDKNLGYFAQATQAALKIFKAKNLDVYILEVGIGGRLDPVNLSVEPDVAVITSIDIDHTDKLGNTREDIGLEKAHIFRAGKPAICGDENLPESVRQYGEKINASLYCYQKDYFFEIDTYHWHWWNKDKTYKHLPLPNLYIQNAATALQVLSCFSLPVSREAIERGLQTAFLAGRCQIMDKPVLQIFDVAHNPASARLLAKHLHSLPCQGKTIAVVGMLKDKDISGTLAPLLPLVDCWYCATLNDPRGASAEAIAQYVPHSILFENPTLAYQAALKKTSPKDRIVVFGSFRTVGEILNTR